MEQGKRIGGRGGRKGSPGGRKDHLHQKSPRKAGGGARSRDASPASSHYTLPQQQATPITSTLAHPPAEIVTRAPLPDLCQRVKSFGCPGSFNYVLGHLERHFKALIPGEQVPKGSQHPDETLISLINTILLGKEEGDAKSSRPESKGSFLPETPRFGALEEMHLLMSLRGHLEEQKSAAVRYCILDAVFDEEGEKKSGASAQLELLGKLTSLAVSFESSLTLSSVALWMEVHPPDREQLSQTLYSDFCVIVPDAMAPLLCLPTVSPHLAHVMTIVFTSLYPFHRVGGSTTDTASPVDPSHLHPPITLLHLLSHWLETAPDFLYPSTSLDPSSLDLPLLRPHSKKPVSPVFDSPLAGLIQWCVLAPLVPKHRFYKERSLITKTTVGKGDSRDKDRTNDSVKSPVASSAGITKSDTDASLVSDSKLDFDSLTANLHANLLAVILSHSKSIRHGALTGDSIAVVVATLLKYSQLVKDFGESDGETISGKVDEAIERLAQFLQISLSTGLLPLNGDDLSSIASTLPRNRLLNMVINHHKTTPPLPTRT